MSLHIAARVPERRVEVDLDIADGQTLALLGPNGSGKSTVLEVLAGLVRPQSGRVVLDDRVLTDVGPGTPGVLVPPHDRRTALLGQDALLFPHLDALENVAFGPRSRGTHRRTARADAQRWLDDVGVGDLARRRPGQLSGGQAQRVAIARALAAEPRLLLLDEPMAALDVAVQPALRQVLRRVLARRTSIIVTHDPLDALLLSDVVAVFDDGRVVERGRSAEVLARPRSGFAGRLAGLNLLRGTWDDGAVRTAQGWVGHGRVEGPVPAQGAAAIAAFRPQAVAIYRNAARDGATGSPRNAFDVRISELEPRADLVRVHAGELTADVTVQAAAELELAVGGRVTFVVKATEVSLYGI